MDSVELGEPGKSNNNSAETGECRHLVWSREYTPLSYRQKINIFRFSSINHQLYWILLTCGPLRRVSIKMTEQAVSQRIRLTDYFLVNF